MRIGLSNELKLMELGQEINMNFESGKYDLIQIYNAVYYCNWKYPIRIATHRNDQKGIVELKRIK